MMCVCILLSNDPNSLEISRQTLYFSQPRKVGCKQVRTLFVYKSLKLVTSEKVQEVTCVSQNQVNFYISVAECHANKKYTVA